MKFTGESLGDGCVEPIKAASASAWLFISQRHEQQDLYNDLLIEFAVEIIEQLSYVSGPVLKIRDSEKHLTYPHFLQENRASTLSCLKPLFLKIFDLYTGCSSRKNGLVEKQTDSGCNVISCCDAFQKVRKVNNRYMRVNIVHVCAYKGQLKSLAREGQCSF